MTLKGKDQIGLFGAAAAVTRSVSRSQQQAASLKPALGAKLGTSRDGDPDEHVGEVALHRSLSMFLPPATPVALTPESKMSASHAAAVATPTGPRMVHFHNADGLDIV